MITTRTLLAAATLAALVGQAVADDASPLAWWKFDEAAGSNAADSAGSNNGTLAGSASFTGGISGNAVSTTSGWVSMGNIFPMLSTSFSMQTWIKTTDTSTASTIIAGKHDAGTFNGYLMRANADTANYGALGKASFYQSNSPGSTAVGVSTVTDGEWHCLIATYNLAGSTLDLYVDGGLEKSIPTASIVNNDKPFMVGGLTVSGNQVNGFNGAVDEVQLYGYVLSPDQVKFLASNPGKAIPAPGTAAFALAGLGAMSRRRR